MCIHFFILTVNCTASGRLQLPTGILITFPWDYKHGFHWTVMMSGRASYSHVYSMASQSELEQNEAWFFLFSYESQKWTGLSWQLWHPHVASHCFLEGCLVLFEILGLPPALLTEAAAQLIALCFFPSFCYYWCYCSFCYYCCYYSLSEEQPVS